MIKTLCRFCLLLALCSLFVYAPEILYAASAPYSLTAPERILLRILLYCDNETSAIVNQAVSTYQKDHPTVHLRVAYVTEQEISQLIEPYPDILICPQTAAAQLPAAFVLTISNSTVLCAVSSVSTAAAHAQTLAAYIVEALASQSVPSEI